MSNLAYAVVIPCSNEILKTCEKITHDLSSNWDINRASARSPYPHITVCSGLFAKPEKSLLIDLRRLAQTLIPFSITPNGYGMWFDNEEYNKDKLLYLRWLHCRQLLQVFSLFENYYVNNAISIDPNYRQGQWQAKTTLAFQTMSNIHISDIVNMISQERTPDKMSVTKLSVIQFDKHNENHIAYLTLNLRTADGYHLD